MRRGGRRPFVRLEDHCSFKITINEGTRCHFLAMTQFSCCERLGQRVAGLGELVILAAIRPFCLRRRQLAHPLVLLGQLLGLFFSQLLARGRARLELGDFLELFFVLLAVLLLRARAGGYVS